MIALDQVKKTYPGDVKALKGISLHIKKGEFVFVVGQSGSGKTTITESCLFKSGATKRFGKVNEGNTVSDYDPEEIKHEKAVAMCGTATLCPRDGRV